MKIGVTGGKGFLGSYLLKSLRDKKFNIKLLSEKEDLLEPTYLKSFVQDLDLLVHLAGLNRDTDYNMFRINTIGTASLLDAIKNYSSKTRLIFASSYQIYSQENSYSKSKELAEEIIKYHSENYGIKSIVLRISNIYGAGGKPFYNSVIATFVHLIKGKKPLTINGDGNQKRDFIYVEDVVNAIEKCIDYKQSEHFEVFDICSSQLISINQIIQNIEELTDQKLDVKYLKREDIISKEKVISNDKTKMILAWKVLNIREGLRKTLSNEKS